MRGTGDARSSRRERVVALTALSLLAGLVVVTWGANRELPDAGPPTAAGAIPNPLPVADGQVGADGDDQGTGEAAPPERPLLPTGDRLIFADNRFLVAYYGTAGTGVLGVLGETSPDRLPQRLERTARPFQTRRHPVQPVYELIVTIADRYPGKDGDYSHDLPRREVQRYLDAAHRHGALLVLDLQPGRSDFLTVARRWEWALKDPWVGLALDPEWRMPRGTIPGQQIGHVDAAEVNRVSAWLGDLTKAGDLPQKLFVLHQFRTDMVTRMPRIRTRVRLAMVQHVDGFGTRREKLATYRHVARPARFVMGMKIFYDEDIDRFDARAVRRLLPDVRFVSYQ